MVKLGGGTYLKTADVKIGDTIKFLTEGEWIENTKYTYPDGNPKVDFVCEVEYSGEKKKLRVNKTNRDLLIESWGDETKTWIGKIATLELENALVAGKRMKVLILNPNSQVKEKEDEEIQPVWDEEH